MQSKREESILRLLGFDRLNERHEPHPDGRFDFVEGYTVDSHLGTVIFPSVEPFRISVKKALGADAGLYVFDALYDSTRVAATQRTEYNRFLIRGSYAGGSSTDDTGTGRVRPGSVQVTAGGVTLAEHIDYEVDYATGAVRIINEEILASGVPVDIRYEDQGTDLIQRRSVFGVDLNYAFNPELNIGATLMHLRETPLDAKMAFGLESMRNTLWGVNLNWRKKSTKLTEWLDALPAVKASEPSHISFDAEFAHLIPGRYKSVMQAITAISTTLNPHAVMMICSTPIPGVSPPLRGECPEMSWETKPVYPETSVTACTGLCFRGTISTRCSCAPMPDICRLTCVPTPIC